MVMTNVSKVMWQKYSVHKKSDDESSYWGFTSYYKMFNSQTHIYFIIITVDFEL